MTDPDWRTRHCADFAVEHVKATTGRDIWEEIGGAPRSPKEGAALYRRMKARSLTDVVTKLLGPSVSPLKAMRGDIVMADGALGICRGELAEFMDQMLPMKRVTKAWPVRGRPEPHRRSSRSARRRKG